MSGMNVHAERATCAKALSGHECGWHEKLQGAWAGCSNVSEGQIGLETRVELASHGASSAMLRNLYFILSDWEAAGVFLIYIKACLI